MAPPEIAAWHHAQVSNGPTEAPNNLIKRVERVDFGCCRFADYGIRAGMPAGARSAPVIAIALKPWLDPRPPGCCRAIYAVAIWCEFGQ